MFVNPAGGIIEVIRTAWDLYQFVKSNMQRIENFVESLKASMENVIKGSIGAAKNMIEQAIADAFPMAMDFMAALAGAGVGGGGTTPRGRSSSLS